MRDDCAVDWRVIPDAPTRRKAYCAVAWYALVI